MTLMRQDGRRHPLVAFLLVGTLAAAQGIQATALRDCPHHAGTVAHAVLSISTGTPGTMPHEAPVPPDVPDHAPDSDHHGPCDCLGPCGASAALQAPASPAESVFAQLAPRRLSDRLSDDEPPLTAARYALPFPNAPPA